LVAGLSVLALAASVVFASSREAPPEEASTPAAVEVTALEAPEPSPLHEAPATAAPAGQAVFDARCKRCHSLDEAVALVKKQPEAKRMEYLTKLLDRHFPPPPAERPGLVQYLYAETMRAKK